MRVARVGRWGIMNACVLVMSCSLTDLPQAPDAPCAADEIDCGGTCTDVMSSPSHCGACDAECSSPGATSACVQGECTFGGCVDDALNCDGNLENGCEVDGSMDALHCGECGNDCSAGLLNGEAGCMAGVCATRCIDGFADCDGEASNGCETDTASDRAHCGECARSCLGGDCADGGCAPRQVAANQGDVRSIAANDSHVFWTRWGPQNDGLVQRALVGDALPPEAIVFDNGVTVCRPFSLALDGATLFVSDACEMSRKIVRSDLTGAGASSLPRQIVGDLVTTDDFLYYLANTGVHRLPAGSNKPVALGGVGAESMAGPAVTTTRVFWWAGSNNDRDVYRLTVGDADTFDRLGTNDVAVSMVAGASRLFFTTSLTAPGGGLRTLELEGPAAQTSQTVDPSAFGRIARDETHVYHARSRDDDTELVRRPFTDDVVETVVPSIGGAPTAIAVTPNLVAWVAAGEVWLLAR